MHNKTFLNKIVDICINLQYNIVKDKRFKGVGHMSYINTTEVKPENNTGLNDYKFVTPYKNAIYVYHKNKMNGRELWLCCTEGWRLKPDGKWHETISCGWKSDRIADTVENIFDYYRNA